MRLRDMQSLGFQATVIAQGSQSGRVRRGCTAPCERLVYLSIRDYSIATYRYIRCQANRQPSLSIFQASSPASAQSVVHYHTWTGCRNPFFPNWQILAIGTCLRRRRCKAGVRLPPPFLLPRCRYNTAGHSRPSSRVRFRLRLRVCGRQMTGPSDNIVA